jgi:glutathione S-transferase
MTEPYELYAMPFSCSLAAHLALREAGLPHRLRWVKRGATELAEGGDYLGLNPKRKVPLLVLPGGEKVTENAAVLTAIADAAGPHAADPIERRRTLEWLTFIGTELHKQVLFVSYDRSSPAEAKADVKARLLPPVLEHLERSLTGREWLEGPRPLAADFYLSWALLLFKDLGVDLTGYPAVNAYRARWAAREAFAAVVAIERAAFAAAGGKR